MNTTSVTQKVAKLLALAENAGTEAEAESAFAKAQAIATAHSISLAVARQSTEDKTKTEQPTHRRITVGRKRQHANSNLIRLFSEIGKVQGVKITIAHDSTFINAFGFPSDIDLTEQIWAAVALQMTRFGETYLALDAWRSETTFRAKRVKDNWGGTYEEWNLWPVTKQTARHSFQESFIWKVGERLAATAKAEEERAEHFHDEDAAPESDTLVVTGVGLALREKTAEVESHYARHSNARGSWRGGGGQGGRSQGASAAGTAAGARARLGSSPSIGRGARSVSA